MAQKEETVEVAGHYTKLIRDYTKLIAELQGQYAALHSLLVMTSHLIINKGIVATSNGLKYSAAELAKETGVSIHTAYKSIDALKRANLVKSIKYNDRLYLAVNPAFACNGNQVLKKVWKAFYGESD